MNVPSDRLAETSRLSQTGFNRIDKLDRSQTLCKSGTLGVMGEDDPSPDKKLQSKGDTFTNFQNKDFYVSGF